MTLILGATARSHIVLTADGASYVTIGDERSRSSNTLTKIFPITGKPAAVVHHGQDTLASKPIREFLEPFVAEVAGKWPKSLKNIVSDLDTFLTPYINLTMLGQAATRMICGFWIAGFDSDSNRMRLSELVFERIGDRVAHVVHQHGDLTIGGDGGQSIKRYVREPIDSELSFDRIAKRDIGYSKKLHHFLFERADLDQRAAGADWFGGHRHQLIIDFKGNRWSTPPAIPIG